jgi:CubicO group peptidase (beta-lactamase class C family)
MLFGTTHTLDDILHGLAFLKPYRGFRTGYAYDNILYLIAGMLTERVSRRKWEDFVTERLLRPLGMLESAASFRGMKGGNVASRRCAGWAHSRRFQPARRM